MAADQARELRVRGIEAAKAGNKEEARQLLQQSLRLDPSNEAAWLWMASVSRDRNERLFSLRKLLEINPHNETGLRALEAMGISPAQSTQSEPATSGVIRPLTATQEAAQVQQQQVGVPIPDAQRIAAAQQQADSIVREYLAPPRAAGPKWVQKTKGRAGERDAFVLRLYVASAVAGVLIVFAIVAVLVVLNTPSLRSAVFAPTNTPTFTPTVTPTNTPGATPTASPTPVDPPPPTATFDPDFVPRGDRIFQPQPTAVYPSLGGDQVLRNAVNLLNSGHPDEAQALLEDEKDTLVFNPNPFYYEALAHIALGNPERGRQVLAEAQQRLEEGRSDDTARSLIDSGFAQVWLALGEEALANNDLTTAREFLDQAQQSAEDAIGISDDAVGDFNLAEPYLVIARRYRIDGNFDRAIEILDMGLEVERLRNDVRLVIEKGEVYFEQGEYDLAKDQAFLAIYMNPFLEAPHRLRIRAALADNDPSLAVIFAQNYLFYFPGSVTAYKLLGDARLQEGNTDLALAAYSQALEGPPEDPSYADALVARAQIYADEGRFDLAREDLDDAVRLTDDRQIQAQRMIAAYHAGNFTIAEADAQELLGTGVLPDDEIRLLRARILVDNADNLDGNPLSEALSLLNSIGDGLPPEQAPIADEYRARANLGLRNFGDALTNIDRALTVETGTRHYLRGQILEGMGRDDDAREEYEWVLTWAQVYPYPFAAEAQMRLEDLSSA